MPRVTVIIPTYNTARYIKEAVDSVLAQTYKDIALIVVDDGSTDNTREILEPYGDKLNYVYKPNGGFASALNEGIRRADSQFIAWLSADDVFLRDKIALQVQQLDDHADLGVSYTAYYEIDTDGRRLRSVRVAPHYAQNVTVANLLRACYVNGSSCLFRRTCFENAGLFDEGIGPAADWEMWMRLAALYDFGYLDVPLLNYRRHVSNTAFQRTEKMIRSGYAAAAKVVKRMSIDRVFGLPELGSVDQRKHAAATLFKAASKLRNIPPVRRMILVRSLRIWPIQMALLFLPAVVMRELFRRFLVALGARGLIEKFRQRLAKEVKQEANLSDAIFIYTA